MRAIRRKQNQSVKCMRNCNLCNALPPHIGCNTKNLVYEYTCRLCQRSYVGYTARGIRFRHAEHKRSISKADDTSALATHLKLQHIANQQHTIDSYSLNILQHCRDAVAASLAENYYIKERKPELNRKHEGCAFDYV